MKQPIEMVGTSSSRPPTPPIGPARWCCSCTAGTSVCYDPTGNDDYTDDWPCPAPFAEIPSHLGYDYVQQVLATQGYTTVSVRVNGINAQDFRLDDGGADARAQIVERHLDYWTGLAADHQVDLDQVVLVGHSRGGEGVDRAVVQIPAERAYRIAGQVLLAPTDFAPTSSPYVPTVTVLPYCDGDVYDIQGQQFIDTGRDLSPASARRHLLEELGARDGGQPQLLQHRVDPRRRPRPRPPTTGTATATHRAACAAPTGSGASSSARSARPTSPARSSSSPATTTTSRSSTARP